MTYRGATTHSGAASPRLPIVAFRGCHAPWPPIRLQRRTRVMTAMREMSVREANQNFSQLIAAAERGETIVITKNGIPVARISPQPADRASDPRRGAAFAALKKACGPNVGRVTASDPSPRKTSTAAILHDSGRVRQQHPHLCQARAAGGTAHTHIGVVTTAHPSDLSTTAPQNRPVPSPRSYGERGGVRGKLVLQAGREIRANPLELLDRRRNDTRHWIMRVAQSIISKHLMRE
jgi:prevent-host-death family protein